MAHHWQHELLFVQQRKQSELLFVDQQGQSHAWSLPSWENEQLDWLVITTKASDTLTALESIRTKLDKIDRLMLLQNGMGQQQAVCDWLSKHQVATELWVASSTEGAYVENGHVIYAGAGQTFAGPWGKESNQAVTTHNDDAHSDKQPILPPKIIYDEHIKTRLYGKLVINAVINPLTGFYRCHNGELLTNTDYYAHFVALADEVSTIANALQWPVTKTLLQDVENVARLTANNRSSTLQDILKNKVTELPYITGYLLQQAQLIGLSAPLNQILYSALYCEENSAQNSAQVPQHELFDPGTVSE